MNYLSIGTNSLSADLFLEIKNSDGVKPIGGLWATEHNNTNLNYNDWVEYLCYHPYVLFYHQFNAAFKTSRFFSIAERYVYPSAICFFVTDCMESSVRISAFLFFVFSITVFATCSPEFSITSTLDSPSSSIFPDKKTTVLKLAEVSELHPANAA